MRSPTQTARRCLWPSAANSALAQDDEARRLLGRAYEMSRQIPDRTMRARSRLRGVRPLDGASGVGCAARDGAAVEQAGDAVERELRLVRKVRHPLAQERFRALAVARTADRRRERACGSCPRRTIG